MVASRIERKRAYDREAQRANRAKTKAYIRHLEEAVETLSNAGNSASPPNVYSIQQQTKIRHLETVVGQIRSIVQNVDDGFLPTSEPLFENRPGKTTPQISHDASPFSQSPEEANYSDCSNAPPPCTLEDLRLWTGLDHAPLQQMSEVDNFFILLSNAMEELERNCISEPLADVAEDEDILAQVMVFGWETVAAHRSLDRVWRFLRTIDEGVYWQAKPLEKMVNLHMMRLMLVHKIRPPNQCRRPIPPFMAKTRLQQTSTYPTLVDYIVWPSFRNYMVYHGSSYMCVTTAAKFATHLRFRWAYQLRDVYMINKITGRYKFSSAFLSALNDIRSYDLLPFDEHTPAMPSTTSISMSRTTEDFPFDLLCQFDQVDCGSLSNPINRVPEVIPGALAEVQVPAGAERRSTMVNQG